MTIYNDRGQELFTIDVDDSSYRYRELCGDGYVQLEFSSPSHIEIPLLSHIFVGANRYTLIDAPKITARNTRDYAYVARFEGSESLLSLYQFRNTIDSRLKFSFTGTPEEHLLMLISVLRKMDRAWTDGVCIAGSAKTISYDYLTCREALELMAKEFGTEWEAAGYKVSLHKVEYFKSNPLAVAYGKGNGLLSGVGRATFGNSKPLSAVYPQGGDRNIDPSKYGTPTLLLPKAQSLSFDGNLFEDELGYNADNGITYYTSTDGTRVYRGFNNIAEGALDCTDIYPQREGRVSSIVERDVEENFYDIVDDTIPETLDFEQYRIAGETMTIVFQSGMLAGREFTVSKYAHLQSGSLPARRFEIVPQAYDGVTMPGGDFMPAAGDRYAIFGIVLPDAYIADNDTKSGAEWDMFRKCIKHLYNYEKPQYSFTGQLDPKYVRENDAAARICAGAYISFTNEAFQPEPVLLRIASVKDFINAPQHIEITIKESPLRATARLREVLTNSRLNTVLERRVAESKRSEQAIHKLGSTMGGGGQMLPIIETVPTSSGTTIALKADAVTIIKGSPITSHVTITALNAPQSSGYDNKWILRLAYVVSGIRITYPTGVVLKWKDGNALTQTSTLGTYEITIRKGNSDGGYYLAEWKFYPQQ